MTMPNIHYRWKICKGCTVRVLYYHYCSWTDSCCIHIMSCLMKKPVAMCPTKTQISLGMRPVWTESSLCAQWVAKDPRFLQEDSEDSDQAGRVPRLIWVFAGSTVTLLVLSWGGFLVSLLPKDLIFRIELKWIRISVSAQIINFSIEIKHFQIPKQIIEFSQMFDTSMWQ